MAPRIWPYRTGKPRNKGTGTRNRGGEELMGNLHVPSTSFMSFATRLSLRLRPKCRGCSCMFLSNMMWKNIFSFSSIRIIAYMQRRNELSRIELYCCDFVIHWEIRFFCSAGKEEADGEGEDNYWRLGFLSGKIQFDRMDRRIHLFGSTVSLFFSLIFPSFLTLFLLRSFVNLETKTQPYRP